MPAKTKPDKPRLELQRQQPLVIAGQPGKLRASLQLSNPTDERIRLRSLPMTSAGMSKRLGEAGRPEKTPNLRLRPGVIRPGHRGPVSLSLDLDPYTPPGEYQAEVEIDGQVQPVLVNVMEKVALRVRPSIVVVENIPNGRVSKRVAVENQGNVPLTINEIGAIYLDDDLQICRTLRHAASAVDDKLRPLEEYLAQILLSAKQVAESSGILRVHNKSGEFVLQPGETRLLDLEVRVPPSLDKRGRYRGIAALYTANLAFVIVPASGPQAPKEDTPEKPAPKSARKAPAGE